MTRRAPREGETRLPFDPAEAKPDASLVFIGRVHSPWSDPSQMPKNPGRARELGQTATLEIDAAYRQGLAALDRVSHVIVVAWLHKAERDVIVLKPSHVDAPRGAFSLRSPVRPNPIGISVARILGIDQDAGRIAIDAIDFLDGTPLVDIKPYRPGIDAVPDAVVG